MTTTFMMSPILRTPKKIGSFMVNRILIVLFFFCNLAVSAERIEGRVVGVHDGDTVTLLMAGNQQIKIRLAQIDAPESAQAFGQRSKESLSDMVFNKNIRVEKKLSTNMAVL